MPTRRYYANAAPQQTLASQITSGATTCQVAGSFAGWPTSFPYYATLDLGTASAEVVLVTNVVGTTATITRGQGGTAAISHAAGATFDQTVVAVDLDEANVHTTSPSGVHGVSGSVVGTTDVQTLTNKTLTAPTINGGTQSAVTDSNATHTGDATHPAVIGKATTAGGKTLSLQNSSATEKAFADDAGNLTLTGGLTAASETVSGASTAASYTANGNGAVTGALVPKAYTNEAAATAGLPAPPTGTVVYLTAPTGAGYAAGLFEWSGTAWFPVVTGAGGGCKMTSTSAASITTGTPLAMTWTATTIAGPAALFTAGASGIQVLKAGTYLVSGVAAIAGNATGRRGLNVLVNGTADSTAQSLLPAGVASALRVPAPATLLQLNANDVVNLAVFQDSGGALALSGLAEITVTKIA